MRNFVAASCCAIVGLEILIGVPVAICMAFLCLGGGVTGTYVAETPVGPIYAPTAYNMPATLPPKVCTVPHQPYPTFDPYVAVPSHPQVCPAPVASGLATLPPPIASLPASDPAADPPLAADEQPRDVAPADGDAQQFVARVSGNEPQHDDQQCASPEAGLLDSLQATAQLLYRRADHHEAGQEYDLADRLRALARSLRDEAISIRLRIRDSEPSANEVLTRDPLVSPLPDNPPPASPLPSVSPPEGPTASVGPPPRG